MGQNAAMQTIYQTVMVALERYRGDLPRVATATGVPYRTLQKISRGEVDDPRVGTLQPVIDWLTEQGDLPLGKERATA